MKKTLHYECSECGYQSAGYLGKCPSCGMWGTIDEKVITSKSSSKKRKGKEGVLLNKIKNRKETRIQTQIDEFNRVMGGGIVPDSVSILTAKPGAGKSTLLLQVANDFSVQGKKVLYLSGEESESQIQNRAQRILPEINDKLWVFSGNSMDDGIDVVLSIDPDIIILDSIQTFTLEEFSSRAGSPTQVMECAQKLVELAKGQRPRVVFIVGQMTKADELAGVRALEHLVDTVLVIEGDSSEELRTLYSTKNRYGSTGEMGFFKMTEKGMESINNPSEYFMTKRNPGEEVPGSALTVLREGTRPILVEIEALVSKSFMPYPTRIGECLKREHLQTLLSILEERGQRKLYDKNVVVKTTGNIPLRETAGNLALIMAVVSSLDHRAIPGDAMFIADVGLTGELKKVPNMGMRISEGIRMGYEKIFVPIHTNSPYKDKLIPCRTLGEVINKGFS
ncbi:MAG: DNA repair protein RadA [Tissierellia bacterium]|nr:DNA repair protein RadA [Tissierellia bacterium]